MKINVQKLKAANNLIHTWSDCTMCPIGRLAYKKAFYRGSWNAPIVFVGEGPGKTEDLLGAPFVGRAGRLLDKAILEAGHQPELCFFTNLVLCRPCDGPGKPNRVPDEKEADKCSPRLRRTLELVRPKVVAWLGKVPQSYAKHYAAMGSVHFFLPHPAWLLRQGGLTSQEYAQFMDRLKEAFRYAA